MAVTNSLREKKSKTLDQKSLVYGKLPPQARELEEAVLGAMMLEKQKLADVIEIITDPKCFYVDSHQKIYAAIKSLFGKGSPVDMLTVTEELRSMGDLELIGGAYYVTKLTYSVISSANVEQHARIVVQKYIQRELIRLSGDVINQAYEETTDVFDLLDQAEANLYEITDKYLRKNFNSISDILIQTMKEIEEHRNSKDDFTGVPTGYAFLDKITGGWQNTDLVVLAARPSVGKTAFALNLVMNAAMNPHKPVPTAFFSLEMSTRQIVKRMLSATTEVHMEKVTRGNMEEYELKQLNVKSEKLANSPIFLDDQAALSIMELRAKCRRLKQKHGLGLVVIDYLQLMTHGSLANGANRENEVSKISRDLKALAKELEVPIIALSQLNRGLENRKESKVPQLSDLRESGAIEQDADMVMFLYRPEYHEISTDNNNEALPPGLTMLKIAKHRNGSLENVYFKALLEFQKFLEIGLKDQLDYNSAPTSTMSNLDGISSYNPSRISIDRDPTLPSDVPSSLKIDDSISFSSKMNNVDFLDNLGDDDFLTGNTSSTSTDDDEDTPF